MATTTTTPITHDEARFHVRNLANLYAAAKAEIVELKAELARLKA